MTTLYDANGRCLSRVQYLTNPEGIRETRTTAFFYDEKGNVTVEHTDNSDGSYVETYYRANGSVARTYTKKANGSYWDEHYDESGNLLSMESQEYDNLGGHSVWSDHPDGSREQYYYAADGSVWYNWFDVNGN